MSICALPWLLVHQGKCSGPPCRAGGERHDACQCRSEWSLASGCVGKLCCHFELAKGGAQRKRRQCPHDSLRSVEAYGLYAHDPTSKVEGSSGLLKSYRTMECQIGQGPRLQSKGTSIRWLGFMFRIQGGFGCRALGAGQCRLVGLWPM